MGPPGFRSPVVQATAGPSHDRLVLRTTHTIYSLLAPCQKPSCCLCRKVSQKRQGWVECWKYVMQADLVFLRRFFFFFPGGSTARDCPGAPCAHQGVRPHRSHRRGRGAVRAHPDSRGVPRYPQGPAVQSRHPGGPRWRVQHHRHQRTGAACGHDRDRGCGGEWRPIPFLPFAFVPTRCLGWGGHADVWWQRHVVAQGCACTPLLARTPRKCCVVLLL
jgi:hypothetical protein